MENAESEDNNEEPVANDPIILAQSINQIESTIYQLSDESTIEQVVHGINLTSILLSRAKLLRQTLEQAAVGWIGCHGPIEIGNIRYTTGYQKRVICLDVPRCMQVILDACNGDMFAFCNYLRSDPYKYGSVNDLVGDDRFAILFRVEQKPKLIEGKPQKELIRVDRRYVRSR